MNRIFALLLTVATTLTLFAGCSSATKATPDPINQDNNPGYIFNPGGNSGGSGNQLDTASLGPSTPIHGANAAAPLGTNPDYNMQLLAPNVMESSAASRTGSGIADGDIFEIVGLAVTSGLISNPAEVDYAAASSPEFNEGSNVRLWLKFETASAVTLSRNWSITGDASLSLSEPAVTTFGAGVQNVALDFVLPLLPGTANGSATLAVSMETLHGTSVVVVIDDGDFADSASLSFTIVNLPDDPQPERCWQMAWEKALVQTDYDYNDLVCRVCAQETLDDNGLVRQIDVRVKALARGEGYSADWQFNLDSDFGDPSITATSTTQQYDAGGAIDGPQRVWRSSRGVSIPVFTPVRNVLPSPNGPTSTSNVIAGEQFIQGGYVDIRIILDQGIAPGSYTPLPYTHQILIEAEPGNVYIVGLTTNRGGSAKDNSGKPLGFILPDQYAWSLEGRPIWNAYPSFTNWVTWLNDASAADADQPLWWQDAPIKTTGNTKNCYSPEFFVGGLALPIPD